jgi:flavin-dependent dehydrogenase
VPPQIKPILDHLGLWQSFAADQHSASYRTLSAWGGPQLLSNEFLFHTQQVGWRLDRARFDAMMLRAATARVAHVAGKVGKLEFMDGIWSVRLNDGAIRTARAVVDATGRAAVLARLHGLQPQRLDRLVSCFAFCENRAAGAGELMIEAVHDGWWYTAALPDGRRVIAFMSDADIVRRLDLGQRDRWMHALGETEHVRAVAAGAEPFESPQFRGAGSQMVSCDAGQPLICVGDAASSFDPVSGQGIVKALRSGVFASYAIADHLERGDSDGLRRYGAFVKSEFAAYRNTLRDCYAQEQRWPDSVFWQRRRDSALCGDQSLTSPLPAAASL